MKHSKGSIEAVRYICERNRTVPKRELAARIYDADLTLKGAADVAAVLPSTPRAYGARVIEVAICTRVGIDVPLATIYSRIRRFHAADAKSSRDPATS